MAVNEGKSSLPYLYVTENICFYVMTILGFLCFFSKNKIKPSSFVCRKLRVNCVSWENCPINVLQNQKIISTDLRKRNLNILIFLFRDST